MVNTPAPCYVLITRAIWQDAEVGAILTITAVPNRLLDTAPSRCFRCFRCLCSKASVLRDTYAHVPAKSAGHIRTHFGVFTCKINSV